MRMITIGIPAYNEEKNIYHLILSLTKQTQLGFSIKKILLLSDGSTDNTIKEAKKIKNNFLKIIDSKERKGLAFRLNQIINLSKTEILIIINADVIPENNLFLYNLIRPIVVKKAELTSAKLMPLPVDNFFGKVIRYGNDFKNYVFENYKKGNNVYLCNGTARAFSYKLYKKIDFKESYGEDAYSYLICTNLGYRFWYSKEAIVFYKIPDNYKDYIKQGIRFIKSKKLLYRDFDKKFVDENYNLPLITSIKYWIRFFIKSPIYTSLYTLLVITNIVLGSLNNSEPQKIWEISTSTKSLIHSNEI